MKNSRTKLDRAISNSKDLSFEQGIGTNAQVGEQMAGQRNGQANESLQHG